MPFGIYGPQTKKYSLTTSEQWVDISGGGKVIIHFFDNDVRMAFDQTSLTDDYFLWKAGDRVVLDQPVGIRQNVFMRSDSGTATVRVAIFGAHNSNGGEY